MREQVAPVYTILFIMNGAKPPRGGEFVTFHLITHLRRDLFRPVVLYFEEGVLVKEIRKSGIEVIPILLPPSITHIYPRKNNLYNPLFLCIFLWHFFLSGCLLKVYKLLREREVHLIFCADNLSKLIGGLAGKAAGRRIVAHCHDDFKEDALGKIMRMFYLLLLDRILAVSEKVQGFFTVKGEISRKAVTVHNGINAESFDPAVIDDEVRAELSLGKDSIVIGSVGTLERDKGQKYLLSAIKKLREEGVGKIMCLICGSGSQETELKGIVAKEGLGDAVKFLGYRNDIPQVMRAMDIIAITSLTIESFSLVAAEAMAMNVPVIATNVGGLPEVVENGSTGLLVPPGDVDALCGALRYLIENPAKRHAMGARARERVLSHFTIEENVRKTEGIFLDLLREC